MGCSLIMNTFGSAWCVLAVLLTVCRVLAGRFIYRAEMKHLFVSKDIQREDPMKVIYFTHNDLAIGIGSSMSFYVLGFRVLSEK